MLPSHLLRMISLCISGDTKTLLSAPGSRKSASLSFPNIAATYWPAAIMAGMPGQLGSSAR